MGFWDHVNDELKKAVEEGWSAVKEGARTGKLKLRIHNLHRDAERRFKEMGGIVYEASATPAENPLERADIQRLVGEIKNIERETAELEEEIARLRHKEIKTEA